MPDLQDHVILITGANRGQGKAIAQHLASLGSRVVVTARNYEQAEKLALAIGSDRAYPIQLDISKEEDWQVATEKVIGRFG